MTNLDPGNFPQQAQTGRRTRLRRAAGVAGLVTVPLIVVGLFAGALSAASAGTAKVPAAIVNNDQMVQQTAADGSTTPVLAGRLLVTALTAPDGAAAARAVGGATAFDWKVTNTQQAQQALQRGEVYAVLTIPSGFSAAIVSLSTAQPGQGQLTVQTDDAHGYLAGSLTSAAAAGVAAIFGDSISQRVVSGLVGGYAGVRGSLGTAADGAQKLVDGATGLGSGLGALSSGAASAQQGATSLRDGLQQYSNGVSSLSAGLGRLSSGAGGLSQLPAAVRNYTGGVADSAAGLRQVLASDPTLNPQTRAALERIAGGLDTLSGNSGGLIAGADGAAAVASGTEASATAARQLAAGSASLNSGAASLSSGLGTLRTGADSAKTGAGALATGAQQLATGLRDGVAKIPQYSDPQVQQIASVTASPVALTAVRNNPIANLGQAVATLLIPVGLWVGALAVFLAARPLAATLLRYPVSTGRLVVSRYLPAAAGTLTSAILLVALLHAVLGVSWALAPATAAFALLIAAAFTAIHLLLTTLFGRAGLVLSLLLLALQLAATGGLYPVELLAAPFPQLSPLLPLTAASGGLQALLTGGNALPDALLLAGVGILALAFSYPAMGRRRSLSTRFAAVAR